LKIFDMYGEEVMDIRSLRQKGDDLVVKGKLMGYVPISVYLRPEELWRAVRLLSWACLLYLPVMVVRGCWRSSLTGRTNREAEEQKPVFL
jgi:hypothetical protein